MSGQQTYRISYYIKDEEDDGIPFEEKMADLTSTLKQQIKKEQVLNEEIATQLSKIGMSL